MRLVKAAKASPHAKFYSLSTACTIVSIIARCLKFVSQIYSNWDMVCLFLASETKLKFVFFLEKYGLVDDCGQWIGSRGRNFCVLVSQLC